MVLRATLVEQTEVVELDLVFLHRVKSARECTGRGVRQYVILGAGLDTFTQRRPAEELLVAKT
jgi:hypothetical protein